MSSSMRPAISTSVKGSEAPASPQICSHEAQTLTSGLSSTPGPTKCTTSTVPESISRKKVPPIQGALNSKNTQIGTPRAMGALRHCRSPALLHHLTGTPSITYHTRFSIPVKNPPSPKFSTRTEPDNEDDEDSLSESTDSSDELKAQLVLNATRAERDVCLVEKTLADCILKENTALGKLYKFEATEAERKLEDANIDIGFVCHSVRKCGITLYEDSKPRKRHRQKETWLVHKDLRVRRRP
ncbi:hypothetical protein P692DRAFT_20880922 [Suillus brevipes Sb2]|nr:hypothetical protein P692DRAFT_20880922 [Suillus brevipes Sb2]